MRLHGAAQRIPNVGDLLARRRAIEPRQTSERGIGGVRWQRLVRLSLQVLADDEVSGSAAEHEQIQQRIRAQTIGAVNRHAGAFADREEPRHDCIRVTPVRSDDLAMNIGRIPPIM